MSVLLRVLIPHIIEALLMSHVPGVVAQGGTNATCGSGYEWMANSKGQSPCLVSSWLLTPCSSPADSFIYPLGPGQHYDPPLNNTKSATPCRCNTVVFSTMAACATCQSGADHITSWVLYSQNCSESYIQTYPENIPSDTAVPAWAYLDVTVNNSFDPVAAQAVAAQSLPESTAQPASSQTSGLITSTQLATSSDTTALPTATGDDFSSRSKAKSNAGRIAGGVVGGIAGLTLVGLAVFFVLRHKRNSATTLVGNVDRGQQPKSPYANYDTDREKSAVASTLASAHRFYDPNDPRTFPTQDSYASVGASGGSNLNFDTQISYHGAPEL